ncbi:hypothetical protein HK099_002994 [Clydaea vesicula]|uniref:Protein kinase domain-containing protein n=1 Tax=Clydaea vesicula TaxID=447962 RepID=A0AAD5U2H9_9FUNG|nr:hypothetical protein HK099_002994 [Clydaea vesicula]
MGQKNSKQNPAPPYSAPQAAIDLSQFTLIYQLGKGTFCKVLAAENTTTGEVVALKYCLKEKLLEKKAINHIIQERNLLEELEHPFICNLKYSFQDSNYVYMVLELMTGNDLRAHVGTSMPENILLDECGHAYLTDFNVAVNFKPGQPLRSVAGTEPYMAPELFSTSQIGYYTSVDWWSLGVVMYEMIYADRPFRGKHKRENIIKGEYRMPNSKFTHISTSCKSFINELLQTQVNKRLGCGLEGMKKYKSHPFFKLKYQSKVPKNAIAPVPSDGAGQSAKAPNLAPSSDSLPEKIKPINWSKLNKKLIDPPFKPRGFRNIPENSKKKREKDIEGEKLKEKDKDLDLQIMIDQQNGVGTQCQVDYPALTEKFLYYDYRFKVDRQKQKRKEERIFVDLDRVARSCSSLISMQSQSQTNSIPRSTQSGLGLELPSPRSRINNLREANGSNEKISPVFNV